MRELNEQQLHARLHQTPGNFSLFIYTPFCGTCKLAKQMISVIVDTYPQLQLFQTDIQYIPALRKEWRLTSVPALIRIAGGQPQAIRYALHSIPEILQFLQLAGEPVRVEKDREQ